ncbi:MAG: hypothetical protein ABIV93_01675, partial [Byssovorax sp.]
MSGEDVGALFYLIEILRQSGPAAARAVHYFTAMGAEKQGSTRGRARLVQVEEQVTKLVRERRSRSPPALGAADQIDQDCGIGRVRARAVDVGIQLVGSNPEERNPESILHELYHRGHRIETEPKPIADVEREPLGLAIEVRYVLHSLRRQPVQLLCNSISRLVEDGFELRHLRRAAQKLAQDAGCAGFEEILEAWPLGMQRSEEHGRRRALRTACEEAPQAESKHPSIAIELIRRSFRGASLQRLDLRLFESDELGHFAQRNTGVEARLLQDFCLAIHDRGRNTAVPRSPLSVGDRGFDLRVIPAFPMPIVAASP